MSSELTCEYCGSVFSFKTGLLKHHKTARYCLQLQGKTAPTVQCNFCLVDFANRTNLDLHQMTCPEKREHEHAQKLGELSQKLVEIAAQMEQQKRDYEQKHEQQKRDHEQQRREYDQKIEQIHKAHQEALFKLASQKTSTTVKNVVNHNHNINISAPLDLSVENVKKVIDQHLTLQVIGDGQVGVANMLHQNLLTDDNGQLLYVCTDASRGHFTHLDKSLQPMKDVKATRLKAALVEAKVGQKAIETVQANMTPDDERFPHYEVKAMEVLGLHSNQDAKFRGQLAAVCVPIGGEDDQDENVDADRMQHE